MTGLSKWSRLAVAALGLLGVAERCACADTIVYATSDGGGNSTFGSLDLTTGQYNAISTLSVLVGGLTADSNGHLYASATNGELYTISGAGVASRFGNDSLASGAAGQFGLTGLAYAGSTGFYGTNANNGYGEVLDHVASNGRGGITAVGSLTTQLIDIGSGELAYGPNGTLFTNFQIEGQDTDILYSVSTSNGAAMAIGTGLQNPSNDALVFVYAGGMLYGIDSGVASGSGNIGIYTIDTDTGVATATGVNVSGLASGYTLDTAAGNAPVVVPEPSSLALMGLGGIAGLGSAWRRRRAKVAA